MPVQRGREELLLELVAVVSAEQEVTAVECDPDLGLGAAAVAAVESSEGVVQVVDGAVFGSDLRHERLHSGWG